MRNTPAGQFDDFELVSLGQAVRFQIPRAAISTGLSKEIQRGLILDVAFGNLPCAADFCAGFGDSPATKAKALLQPIRYMRTVELSTMPMEPISPDVAPEPWRESLVLPPELGGDSAPARASREVIKFVEALPANAQHLIRFKVLLELQGLSPADQVQLVANLAHGRRVGIKRPDPIRALLFPESPHLSEQQVVAGFTEYVRSSGLSTAGFDYAMRGQNGHLSSCLFDIVLKASKKVLK